jgi:hypothetical protein
VTGVTFFKRQAAIREEAMQWAMFTASSGEDPLVILARAQLYEDYIKSGLVGDHLRVRPDPR